MNGLNRAFAQDPLNFLNQRTVNSVVWFQTAMADYIAAHTIAAPT